jgi:hypothetical protein
MQPVYTAPSQPRAAVPARAGRWRGRLQESIQIVAPGSDVQETAASSLTAAHWSGKAAVTTTPERASPASATTLRHIPSLDGIRAGGFLIVFGSHALSGSWGPFGVTVFFFLSGFLITTLMRAEYEKNGSVNLRHFWSRRALRILPPLYLVVLGSALLALAVYPPGTVHGAALASQLLFYANYYEGQPEVPEPASSGHSRSKSISICSFHCSMSRCSGGASPESIRPCCCGGYG